jgi:hypothetical protein
VFVLGPRQQGDLGEFSAMQWIAEQGGSVYLPLGHSPDVDLVADLGGELLRVQVKTCRRLTPAGNYCVMLETKGGNQSWNGVVRRFDPSRYDRLFVLVGDGRRWFIPSGAIEGTGSISLGGPKYAEYEIEPGRAFAQTAKTAR